MRRLGLLLALAACGGDPPAATPARAVPLVYTTFYPTTYFARRIAGGRAEVVCPLPRDADPIFWRPPDDVVRAYEGADLIVLNGAGFEKWVETAPLPDARVVETARPFRDEWIEYAGAPVHSHGAGGAHSHEGLDGHTWLDPVRAKAQAKEILAALRRRLPAHAEELQRNFAALAADLDALDAELRGLAPGPLLASHPAYNYLARRYGWTIENLDLDPEDPPSPAQYEAIAKLGRERGAALLLWEGEPRPEIAARLGELGLRSVLFAPCEQPPAAGDYLAAMRANVARLRQALGG